MTAMHYSGGCGVYVCEDAPGGGGGQGKRGPGGAGEGGGEEACLHGQEDQSLQGVVSCICSCCTLS